MTLGCQDAQHRTGVPLGPTASNTKVLCWSGYTGSIQAQRAPTAALAQLPIATGSTHGQEVFQPRLPLLLVCSPAVATWEVWVKLGEKGHAGVVTACGGAATAASVLHVHGLSLHHGHRGLGPCLQQAGRTEVFPMNPVMSFSICPQETEREWSCSRETGGDGKKKTLERN